MSRAAERASIVSFVAVAGALAASCAQPCENDIECPEGQHCAGEGEAMACVSACLTVTDCGFGEACSARGRCEADPAIVTFLSPAEDALVDEEFDVDLEVRFVGREAVVTMALAGDGGGSACGGFAPATVTLPGAPDRETTHSVLFPAVRSAGTSYILEVTVVVDGGDPRFARRTLSGPTLPEPIGIELRAPVPGDVPLATAARSPVAVDLDLSFGFTSPEIWGRAVPSSSPPTSLRLLARDTDRLSGVRHPVALGAQTLELLFTQGGTPARCDVSLVAEAAEADPIEVALSFAGSELSDLDLWVYVESDDGDTRICEGALSSGPCLGGYVRPGLASTGEEQIGLALKDGIYGVAVLPGAVSDPVSALVRLSRDGAHQEFIGPFTVQPGQGEVWLAARLYVVGGVVTSEPLGRVSSGAPSGVPSTW